MGCTTNLEKFGARLRALIARWPFGLDESSPDFNELALELFGLQFMCNPVYRRFCEQRGIAVGEVRHWSGIPAVAAAAFKDLNITCIAEADRSSVFHSSGTTAQRPSRHFHNAASLELYEQSVVRGFGEVWNRMCGDEKGVQSSRFVFLTPPPLQAPHSSLVQMFDTIRREWGSAESRYVGRVAEDRSWVLEKAGIAELIRMSEEAARPLHVFGTAFSFVHLLEDLERRRARCALPEKSIVMETGGYKGRSRVLTREELYAEMERELGINSTQIIGEYGMSELGSQAYRFGGSSAKGAMNGFISPPWSRFEVVSPETGRPVQPGETGLMRVYDLANVFSVMAIQTEDLARRLETGFELLGRAAEAEARGCSLMPADVGITE